MKMETTEKLEYMLFGAYLLDCGGIRERVTSADFENDEIAACVQEIEQHTSGVLNNADVRKVPAFLEKLKCSTVGRAINAIEKAVKANRRRKQIGLVCRKIQSAQSDDERERLYDKLIDLRGDKS